MCAALFYVSIRLRVIVRRSETVTRTHKLLLFYSALLLGAFDLIALSSRLFERSPDPISWEKVFVAVAIQALSILIWGFYLSWLSATGRRLFDGGSPYSLQGFGLIPVIMAGLLAAFSITVLHNAWNCGNRPLPTSRGMKTCPA